MTRRGFTLIEVLVCMALTALLMALAVPSYRHSVLRSRRHEAQAALYRVQALQERHYFDHARYASSLQALGVAPTSDSHWYALALHVGDDGQTWRLEAAAVGSQADDAECGALTLDETQTRGSTGGERCWR